MLVACVNCLPGRCVAAATSQKSNVLLIITDQQHAGMLSCAGNRYVRTPALDGLAASGARFERAYCANPVCAPSRFAMMTGVLPSRIGMETNEGVSLRVSDEILAHSMGRVFRDAGYETAYGGKLHTPMELGKIGFELLTKDERMGLADACCDFLRAKRQRPFLLVASFINPHDICYMAIQDYIQVKKIPWPAVENARLELQTLDEALKLPVGMSRKEFFAKLCPPLPANFKVPPGEAEAVWKADNRDYRHYIRANWSEEQWRLHRWAYARLTERVDAEIGKVLGALRATGLEDNTLVVFTSDHGEMGGAHRLEHKSVPYEEATRVPFIISRKGVVKPGFVDRKHLVSSALDLIPTLCDFAGIPKPPSLHGRSLRPLAEGRAAPWRNNLVTEGGSFRVLRTARYKYVAYDSGQRREQLMDLENDPGEMQNLAMDPAHAEILANHRRLLVHWYEENGETLSPRYVLK